MRNDKKEAEAEDMREEDGKEVLSRREYKEEDGRGTDEQRKIGVRKEKDEEGGREGGGQTA